MQGANSQGAGGRLRRRRSAALQQQRGPLPGFAALALHQSASSRERRRDLVGLVAQQPSDDQGGRVAARRARPAPAATGSSRLATTVAAAGNRLAAQVEPAHVDRHAVGGCVGRGRGHRGRLVVDRHDGRPSPAWPRRWPARPSHSPGRPATRRGSQLAQQLQAHARGVVGARPERLAGIDDDVAARRSKPPAPTVGAPAGVRRPGPAGGSASSRRTSRRAPRSLDTSARASPAAACRRGSSGSSPGAP